MVVDETVELTLGGDYMFGVIRQPNVNPPICRPAVLETASLSLQSGLVEDAAPDAGEVFTDEDVCGCCPHSPFLTHHKV